MDQLSTIVRATARTNIWIGSVRAGKTVASVAAWIDYVSRSPMGSLHAIVGKTSGTLDRNIVAENLRPRLGKHLVERRGFVEVFGRRAYLFGANDDRSVDKLMGVTLHSALCDEVSTWSERYYRMLQTRLSPRGARLFGTANPEGPYHWLKAIVDRPDVNTFYLTIDDNPHLDSEYVDSVKAEMRAAGPMFYGRYILGRWVAAEGQIYSFLDNVVDGVPDGVGLTGNRVIGVDVGVSVPSAFVELCQGDDGVVYVTRELYHNPSKQMGVSDVSGQDRLSDGEQVDLLLDWAAARGWGACPIYVDPSAASFRVCLSKRGVMPYGGSKRINDIRLVMKGIGKVQSHFSEGTLMISRSGAPNLVRELAGYSWDEKGTEKGVDRPLKIDDHACDALRYGVVGGWKLWNR